MNKICGDFMHINIMLTTSNNDFLIILFYSTSNSNLGGKLYLRTTVIFCHILSGCCFLSAQKGVGGLS